MPTDNELFSETCGGSCKPVKMPELVDVNTLDLHKEEKSLKKISFNWTIFLVGWICGALCCILLDVLSILLKRL